MPAAGASAAAPAAAVVEEVVVVKEKTVFNVNLTKIDAAQKAKAIREVKAIMPSMNLVEVRLSAINFDKLPGRKGDGADSTLNICPG